MNVTIFVFGSILEENVFGSVFIPIVVAIFSEVSNGSPTWRISILAVCSVYVLNTAVGSVTVGSVDPMLILRFNIKFVDVTTFWTYEDISEDVVELLYTLTTAFPDSVTKTTFSPEVVITVVVLIKLSVIVSLDLIDVIFK